MAVYPKGYKRELKVKAFLEAMGYTVVRSAGSHGPWDLVAYKAGEVRFIQVKSSRPSRPFLERLFRQPALPMRPSYEVWVYQPRKAFEVYSQGGRKWTTARLSTG